MTSCSTGCLSPIPAARWPCSGLVDGFVNAFAEGETGKLKVLAPGRAAERATIFEEYAHA